MTHGGAAVTVSDVLRPWSSVSFSTNVNNSPLFLNSEQCTAGAQSVSPGGQGGQSESKLYRLAITVPKAKLRYSVRRAAVPVVHSVQQYTEGSSVGTPKVEQCMGQGAVSVHHG